MVPADAPQHVAEGHANRNLRDFPFMPLEVGRLRDSTLAIESTGDEFKAWVLLACASWHQVPAGTLPDSDRQLAHLAGLGGNPEKWASVRDMALHGWERSDTGRLSHPVIVGHAENAWSRKQTRSGRLERDRDRKRVQRNLTGPSDGSPPDIRRTSAGSPAERPQEVHSLKGQGYREVVGPVDNVDKSPRKGRRGNATLEEMVGDWRFHLQFDGARESTYDLDGEGEAGLRLAGWAKAAEDPAEWFTQYLSTAAKLVEAQEGLWTDSAYLLSVICAQPHCTEVRSRMGEDEDAKRGVA